MNAGMQQERSASGKDHPRRVYAKDAMHGLTPHRWYHRLFFKRSVVCGLLLIAVGLLPTVGCGPSVEDLRRDGVRYYQNRQYIEAMASLRYALEKSPSDPVANKYMGLSYRALARRKYEQGDVAAARRELSNAIYYFTQTIKSRPNDMEAVALKNESLEARGKYDQALELAERVAVNNRGIGEHFVYLGNEYAERGDYDNAIRAYKMALSSDPTMSRAYAGMGKVYLKSGDQELADDAFRRAQELNERELGLAENQAIAPEPEAREPSQPTMMP